MDVDPTVLSRSRNDARARSGVILQGVMTAYLVPIPETGTPSALPRAARSTVSGGDMLVALGWMVLTGLTHPARPAPIIPEVQPPARQGVAGGRIALWT